MGGRGAAPVRRRADTAREAAGAAAPSTRDRLRDGDDRRGHRHPARGPGLRRRRLRAGARARAHVSPAGERLRHGDRRTGRRRLRQRGGRADHARPARAGAAAPGRDHPPHLPVLLALQHAAALLREALLVHPHHRRPGPAHRAQPRDPLGAGAHPRRPLRRMARRQHRLGGLARALLGDAAPALGVRAVRPHRLHRLLRGAAQARTPRDDRRRGRVRPAPPLHRRGRA